MNRTGVGITTLCSSLLVPDIPGELGGVFEYHLVPWIHTAVTYALTFGFTMTFISRFAAINAPQADKTLEK